MSDYSKIFQMLNDTCTDENTCSTPLGFGNGKILIWILLFFVLCRGGNGFGFGGGCGGNNCGFGGNLCGNNCGCGGNSGGNNCGCVTNNCGCNNCCSCNDCSCCDICSCKEKCCCCGGTVKCKKKYENYIVDVVPNCCNSNSCGNMNQCGNVGFGGNCGFGGFGGNWCQIILLIAIFCLRRGSCKPEIC
ncbi:MAG: hypothetical protein RR891_04315 [Clostridium sp.]